MQLSSCLFVLHDSKLRFRITEVNPSFIHVSDRCTSGLHLLFARHGCPAHFKRHGSYSLVDPLGITSRSNEKKNSLRNTQRSSLYNSHHRGSLSPWCSFISRLLTKLRILDVIPIPTSLHMELSVAEWRGIRCRQSTTAGFHSTLMSMLLCMLVSSSIMKLDF